MGLSGQCELVFKWFFILAFLIVTEQTGQKKNRSYGYAAYIASLAS